MQVNASYSAPYAPTPNNQTAIKRSQVEKDLPTNNTSAQDAQRNQSQQPFELPVEQQVQSLDKSTESQAAKASNVIAVNTNPAVAKYLDNQYAEKNLSSELSGIDVFV